MYSRELNWLYCQCIYTYGVEGHTYMKMKSIANCVLWAILIIDCNSLLLRLHMWLKQLKQNYSAQQFAIRGTPDAQFASQINILAMVGKEKRRRVYVHLLFTLLILLPTFFFSVFSIYSNTRTKIIYFLTSSENNILFYFFFFHM